MYFINFGSNFSNLGKTYSNDLPNKTQNQMWLIFTFWKWVSIHIDSMNTNWLKKKLDIFYFVKKKLNNSIIYLCRLYAKGQVFMSLKDSQIFANINGPVINGIRDSHVNQFAEKEIFKFKHFFEKFRQINLTKEWCHLWISNTDPNLLH